MKKIMCVKWGKKYDSRYVNNLFYALQKRTTIPFELYCFTENKNGIDPQIKCISLLEAKNIEGWWHKLYLFSKNNPLYNPNESLFYIDLDTLITGNIDHILDCEYPQDRITTLHDFFLILQPNRQTPFGIAKEQMGSGLMQWKGDFSEIWNNFIANPKVAVQSMRGHGDQKYIQRFTDGKRDYWQDIYPGQIVSYKVHCKAGLPDNARIVCYHGLPGVEDSITKSVKAQGRLWKPQPWVAQYWNAGVR